MKTAIKKLSRVLVISGIVFFLISAPSFAQQCSELVWEGDYIINTVEDLEALSGYTTVTGYLDIHNLPTTSLKGLECLNYVYWLQIVWNDYPLCQDSCHL